MPHVTGHAIDDELRPQDAEQPGKVITSPPPVKDAPQLVTQAEPVADPSLVTTQLGTVLASDSPLITRARTRAAQAANRRGLLNTSLAVQAGEAAALDVALPIASQQAGQIHQANLAGGQIAATERLQSADIASREALTRETLTSQEQATAAEIAGRQAISESGIAAQERIAASSAAAFDREKATAAVAVIDSTYQQAFAAISANTDIPADTREAYLTHLAALRDSNFEMIEQLYNIDLEWTTPALPPPSDESPFPGFDKNGTRGGGGGLGLGDSSTVA